MAKGRVTRAGGTLLHATVRLHPDSGEANGQVSFGRISYGNVVVDLAITGEDEDWDMILTETMAMIDAVKGG